MPEILSCTSQDLLCCYIKDINEYSVMQYGIVWEIK